MESRIANKLGFVLNSWTFYDIALMKIHKNFHAKNLSAIKQLE